MNKRGGYTLIEMLMVIVILSIVTGLATVVIQGLLGVNRSSGRAFEQQASLARLAETFTADVHAADEMYPATAGKNATTQQFKLLVGDARPIVYRVENNELIRTIKNGERTTQRNFQLPAGSTVNVFTQQQGEMTFVTLVVTPAKTPNGAKGLASSGLRTCAQLARDRRLAEIAIDPPTDQPTEAEAAGEPSGDKEAAKPEEETSDE